MKTICFLKSRTKDLPDIKLESNEDNFIGRNVITKIQDVQCSRKQLWAKPIIEKYVLEIKQIGNNSSALNGFCLRKDKTYKALHGDLIEVLYDKLSYEVVFQPSPTISSDTKESLKETAEVSQQLEVQKMETKADIKSVTESSNPFTIAQGKCMKGKWETVEQGKLLIFTFGEVLNSTKVASYDMDGTLIKTLSGNVFPKNCDDWQLCYSNVDKKLKSLHAGGFRIVIFTNQHGISSGKVKKENFMKKLENIARRINVSLTAFVATGSNSFRKPRIGMWEYLCKHKSDVEISTTLSFFVGDAAGRPECKLLKRRKDHSNADRLMAINVGISFYTPEEHFLGEKTQEYKMPEFDPRTIPSIENPNFKVKPDELEVVIMVGYPASGKSTFAHRQFGEKGYQVINRDKLGSWQKCVSVLESYLAMKKPCVIDNTNPDSESRKRYVEIAKKHNIKCRCFIMETSLHHSKHNNEFRELTASDHVYINDMVYHSYKNKYEEPTATEGFSEIVHVSFVPSFKSEEHKKLYSMFLCEK